MYKALNNGKKLLPICWQDHTLKFNVDPSDLKLVSGEKVIFYLNQVEDIRGNPGERGKLTVTNLRIVWESEQHSRTNLSIGLECVEKCIVQMRQSKVLMASVRCLCITAKNSKGTYQFMFGFTLAALSHYKPPETASSASGDITNWLSYLSVRIATVMDELCAIFRLSASYRNISVHSSILNRYDEFEMLCDEELYQRIQGVMNLSIDEGIMGVFYVTNFRIAWHALNNGSFSVSLPYLQVDAISSRKTKFGYAMVIDTTPKANKYVLGFRVDPESRCKELTQTLRKYWISYRLDPDFGVAYELDDKWQNKKRDVSVWAYKSSARALKTPKPAGVAEDTVSIVISDIAAEYDSELPEHASTETDVTIDSLFKKVPKSASLIPLVPSQEQLQSNPYVVNGTESGLDSNLENLKMVNDSYTGLCAEKASLFENSFSDLVMKKLWHGFV